MAEKKFTEEQLSAINTRDRSLLVSAAAGSGKTATLTERIIRQITDKSDPKKISDMLIVTFTNAAVAELRERISAALKSALSKDPDNRELEEQLYLLPSARISTIDSFCNDILKNNTDRFGISPRYRIADPTEVKILMHSHLASLIDAAYSGELSDTVTPEEFEELSYCLTATKKDSDLEDTFKLLYEKSKSHEMGVGIYRYFAERMRSYSSLPLEENPYVSYAIERAREAAAHYATLFEKILASDTPPEKHIKKITGDIDLLRSVASSDSYKAIKALLEIEKTDLRGGSGKKTLGDEDYAVAKPMMHKALHEKIHKRYFEYSEDEWHSHINELSRLLFYLAAFLEKFDEVYLADKKKRAVLEYSDIERFTYLSLYNEDGTPSELALAEREKYSAVYIDEYQDVNALQNKIFLAVSREDNRFTVGDIKQSIYGFRNARPDLFADMKNSYPPLDKDLYTPTASVFMSKNFRCDKNIVDFVNCIFDNMFDLCRESIGYVSEDRLEFAKIYPKDFVPDHIPPEVRILSSPTDMAAAWGKDGEELKKDMLAPTWTANKVKELIDTAYLNPVEDPDTGELLERKVTPKDIALIIRKDGGRIKMYADALAKLGIPTKTPESKDFFLNAEIQLMLCLLNTVNNPLRDIYLTGLMLSPLFSFTADELYRAREDSSPSLWASVRGYAEKHPENEKFSSFIKTVERYRSISEGMPADELILKLYSELSILTLSGESAAKENLMLLYDFAKKFEASSFRGLYSFINYINTVIDSNASFSAKKAGECEDAVSIVTVHKSKGLEYPIVFLVDAASSLESSADSRVHVAFSDADGLAMKTRIPDGLALVESPIFNVILDKNTDRGIEEELRVYYVALTRARERLFITGATRNSNKEKYENSQRVKGLHRSSFSIRELKTFVDILYAQPTGAKIRWDSDDETALSDREDILARLGITVSDRELRERFSKELKEELAALGIAEDAYEDCEESELFYNTVEKKMLELGIKKAEIKEDADAVCIERLYSLLKDRFSYVYPRLYLTELPEKMSISNLSPSVLDGNEDEEKTTIDEKPRERKKKGAILPEFYTGKSSRESARRGIATHNFMQFFDVSALPEKSEEAELQRLIDEGFLTKENAMRVRLDEIKKFRHSELYREMRGAKKLYREFRFSVMLPSSLFTEDPEKKRLFADKKLLMQGVIDCIIEDADGNLHLIDYKTDRLTREALSDKSVAEEELSDAHATQLSYYALAIEKIFGKAPLTTRIYSLHLGDTVNVKRTV